VYQRRGTHGGGEHSEALLRFTEPLAWSVLESQTGDWPTSDSARSSVANFRDYRDRVLAVAASS